MEMTISTGDKLPGAMLQEMGPEGVVSVDLAAKLKGRKVVIFGLPGAYTGTCTTSHLPSFMRTKAKYDAKGVDEIICVAVNDAFVMDAWAKSTGAKAAGLTLLADPASAFTKAIGMEFSVDAIGLLDRSQRYSLYAEDGVVKVLNHGKETGACEISGGETLLGQI
jgi:glutaredoxin/glutathione-dependent peroxiredoxin